MPPTLLPQDCLLCAAPSGRRLLCAACVTDLPRLPASRCPRCALPSPESALCGRCLAHPPHYDAARAAFRYDFPLDRLVQALKYGQRLSLAGFFAEELIGLAQPLAVDGIVPLPLHPDRLRQRGFNQALEIARPLGRALQRPVEATLCRRIRNTRPQADLPWKERAANLRHAFECSADLDGRRILVVDDVMTTGASLDECARTLKRRGAAEVNVLVVARTLPKNRD